MVVVGSVRASGHFSTVIVAMVIVIIAVVIPILINILRCAAKEFIFLRVLSLAKGETPVVARRTHRVPLASDVVGGKNLVHLLQPATVTIIVSSRGSSAICGAATDTIADDELALGELGGDVELGEEDNDIEQEEAQQGVGNGFGVKDVQDLGPPIVLAVELLDVRFLLFVEGNVIGGTLGLLHHMFVVNESFFLGRHCFKFNLWLENEDLGGLWR
mmetsp:Transcript_24017/g.70868  ORF Transcript_24017/g.70868 Transcript_24017/m.70868 type:complete len:216 (-) Transcript_24017:68-715(-)